MSTAWPAPGRYRFDTGRSLARVFTFKEDGLLSPMAHDLELHTRAFGGHVEVSEDAAQVSLTIDLWTLEVEKPLSGLQKREAEKTLQKKILADRSKARAVLQGSVARATLAFEGSLSLLGSAAKPLSAPCTLVDLADGGFTARTGRIRLLQTSFGITPYKAMMGMLKLKDGIEVELEARLIGG